jgi:oligopeptide/dipeptide ABC transporter ATP-binding protein
MGTYAYAETLSVQDSILTVRNLKTYFFTYDGIVRAVDGVSFSVAPGEALGIVGETGCGKSVTAYSLLRLVQKPGQIVAGKIFFRDQDLLAKTESEMREIRGGKISMIFQEPMTSLNPVFSVGEQLSSVIMHHKKTGRLETIQKTIRSIEDVGIPDPRRVLRQYPHELSGGMRQRVMIAMALSLSPELIICDEPTTYLDVTVQAQILKLIKEMQTKLGASILLITHNLAIVAHYCDRVAVMYAGEIVEIATVNAIFNDPEHPYVQGLLSAIPALSKGDERLNPIPGVVPNLINPPAGCRFHPRCNRQMSVCKDRPAGLVQVGEGHYVACHLYGGDSQERK